MGKQYSNNLDWSIAKINYFEFIFWIMGGGASFRLMRLVYGCDRDSGKGVARMSIIENRYLALQLATQLPRDRAAARTVISELRALVDGWLFDESQPASRAAGDGGGSNIVAMRTGSPEAIPK